MNNPRNLIKIGDEILDIRAISYASMDNSSPQEKEKYPVLFCVVDGHSLHIAGDAAITVWALLESLATPAAPKLAEV